MCQFHTPTTLFPHRKFRTYCIKEWVRISAGVHITLKRNISDPDRNQNPACNFTEGNILLLHIKLTSSKSNITILKIKNQTSKKP
jgi:hypothetical protein